jgi:hypothetical protein
LFETTPSPAASSPPPGVPPLFDPRFKKARPCLAELRLSPVRLAGILKGRVSGTPPGGERINKIAPPSKYRLSGTVGVYA